MAPLEHHAATSSQTKETADISETTETGCCEALLKAQHKLQAGNPKAVKKQSEEAEWSVPKQIVLLLVQLAAAIQCQVLCRAHEALASICKPNQPTAQLPHTPTNALQDTLIQLQRFKQSLNGYASQGIAPRVL
jgi:hypothetical protein